MNTEVDTRLCGFIEDANDGPAYAMMAHDRSRVARVQQFGRAWGYTIWKGNECVGGQKDWAGWTLYDACHHAAEALAKTEGADS